MTNHRQLSILDDTGRAFPLDMPYGRHKALIEVLAARMADYIFKHAPAGTQTAAWLQTKTRRKIAGVWLHDEPIRYSKNETLHVYIDVPHFVHWDFAEMFHKQGKDGLLIDKLKAIRDASRICCSVFDKWEIDSRDRQEEEELQARTKKYSANLKTF